MIQDHFYVIIFYVMLTEKRDDLDTLSLLIYVNCILLAILNFMSCCLFGMDKYRARKKRWRIPEKTLLFYGTLAPLGALLGMIFFHHKTRKSKFYLWIGVCLFLHFGIFYTLYSMITPLSIPN